MNEKDISDSGERRALRRKMQEVLWDFFCEHWWQVIVGLVGFIAGGTVAYVAIYVQLSDARHAAEDAKTATDRLTVSITNLATRDQLEAEKELSRVKIDFAMAQIRELQKEMDQAVEESRHPRRGRR